jgi:hypothetical protein
VGDTAGAEEMGELISAAVELKIREMSIVMKQCESVRMECDLSFKQVMDAGRLCR